MRRLIAFCLLALIFPFASPGQEQADDFYLSVSLTRGERSRDSHSQTTRITLKGQELLYEKRYRGYRSSQSLPIRKSFLLRQEDAEKLKKLVRENDLLTSETIAVADAEGGIRRYFEIALEINLEGKSSSIKISGPRSAAQIRERQIYSKTHALLDAIYKMLAELDHEIVDENRDLIQASGL